MKKIILVSLLLSAFALAFSIVVSLSDPMGTAEDPASATPSGGSESPRVSPQPEAQYVYEDDGVTVRVLVGSEVTVMAMSDYLIGVVSAEMPGVFEPEALKAQAVAARTETLYQMLHGRSAHPEADVCADPGCCQAYADDPALREKWGGDYSMYIAKMAAAVRDTDGLCLTYGGAPIQALFHSSSAGQTAESGEVWSKSLPYLVSVTSPESDQEVPNYVSSVIVSSDDFKDTVLHHYPDAAFPKDNTKWVTDVVYTGSGRIETATLGGVTVTGTVLRSMFGLRSTAARVEIGEDTVTFTTTGYGHGVGMSQYGANTMAARGDDHRDILTWYYSGVDFARFSELLRPDTSDTAPDTAGDDAGDAGNAAAQP